MSISQNLKDIRVNIKAGVELVVVSKYQPIEKLELLYELGERVFGESRPQELMKKSKLLPADIKWHMIGALQGNKVKYLAPFVTMIHSGTSAKLLETINKEAIKCERVIDVLFEIHIAQEQSKHGWTKQELIEYLESGVLKELKNIRLRGVMAMASFSYNETIVRGEFREVKVIFDEFKNKYFNDNEYFDTISMGMSGDYKIAIEEGATTVRVGSSIFHE